MLRLPLLLPKTSTGLHCAKAIPKTTSLHRNSGVWRRGQHTTTAPVPSGLDLGSEKLRRAVFYVPCSEERKIQKSYVSAADCIMYDLEDGVSLNRKDQARHLVINALNNNPRMEAELGVRINGIGSGLEHQDLSAVLQSTRLDVIMVPKVERASDIHQVAEMIEKSGRKVGIIAGIETALGVLNIRDIAAASPLIDALLFAAEDYCADTGIVRTKSRKELYYARALVTTTAHAYKKQAIDMVTMDFRSKETLEEESREGAEMGFTGKQVIHPAQVDMVQELFAPPKDIVRKAERIVQGYEENYMVGKGAFDLDGKAIDMPVIKWAYRVLRRAELARK
ncbi:hypothetical protein H4R99_006864 [Coemansia sp. RSA 1722]|nr:hypothetical protein LPJ57_001636 [Coemansia sp. RSA 486]KAJ2230149.1 hypothetical protein IWW45_005900 [Coemansia sp. RSA 485]KAJ2591142.1 hypothetical protein H4R99_006864 [Coemansia sp. RSA 1722]KAJ2598149.1 hypothetical protein GGF39_002762 [Coemansia sp. RSA 1721]KAJ2634843.1 hypothetical protein GGF40_003958 [Coemansia sp. RSA 1286]